MLAFSKCKVHGAVNLRRALRDAHDGHRGCLISPRICRRSASCSATWCICNRPLGECEQCCDVVGDHRRPDTEAQSKYTTDAGEVWAEDHQPAVADIAFELSGDVAQLAQFAEALLHEHNMRRVGGDRDRTAHRDRHIGFLQCDHFVDAVADKADLVSLTLQFLDIISLSAPLLCITCTTRCSSSRPTSRGNMIAASTLCNGHICPA